MAAEPGAAERSLLLALQPPLEKLLGAAREAERAGFARVWLAETNGIEAAGFASAVLRETRLEVGTAVLPAYTRSAPLLAMTAATLAQLGGRPVHLGIGAGGQAIVERWHGLPFGRPLSQVVDTVRILRAALAGERTDYRGAARRSTGFRLAASPHPPVRVYVGGLGPRMRAFAAREADGLIVTWVPPRAVRAFAAELGDLVAASGRARAEVRLVARAYVAVTDDPDQVRERVRRELTEYLVSPPYGQYFASLGYGEAVAAVQAAFAAGDRTASLAAVPPALVDEVLVAGSEEQVARRLAQYHEAGADEVLIQPVAPERGGDPLRTIRGTGRVVGGESQVPGPAAGPAAGRGARA